MDNLAKLFLLFGLVALLSNRVNGISSPSNEKTLNSPFEAEEREKEQGGPTEYQDTEGEVLRETEVEPEVEPEVSQTETPELSVQGSEGFQTPENPFADSFVAPSNDSEQANLNTFSETSHEGLEMGDPDTPVPISPEQNGVDNLFDQTNTLANDIPQVQIQQTNTTSPNTQAIDPQPPTVHPQSPTVHQQSPKDHSHPNSPIHQQPVQPHGGKGAKLSKSTAGPLHKSTPNVPRDNANQVKNLSNEIILIAQQSALLNAKHVVKHGGKGYKRFKTNLLRKLAKHFNIDVGSKDEETLKQEILTHKVKANKKKAEKQKTKSKKAKGAEKPPKKDAPKLKKL